MTQPVNNLRVRRTQKLLREALIGLIEERGFDTLTVGEITAGAMVSRAAFYRNYRDKYDLVEQIFEEAMQGIYNSISEPRQVHSTQVWVKFFEHIAEYERLYRALLGPKGSPWFVLKMRLAMVDLIKEFGRMTLPNGAPLHPPSDEFVPDLLGAMIVEVITWWLEHGRLYSSAEIARRSIALAGVIFSETSTWQ
jgi:AcrR family transcriptional regulator